VGLGVFLCVADIWANYTEIAKRHRFERGKKDEAKLYHEYEDSFIVSGVRVRFGVGASCDSYMARFCHQRAQT
jgi:hypothetical protein